MGRVRGENAVTHDALLKTYRDFEGRVLALGYRVIRATVHTDAPVAGKVIGDPPFGIARFGEPGCSGLDIIGAVPCPPCAGTGKCRECVEVAPELTAAVNLCTGRVERCASCGSTGKCSYCDGSGVES
jgi:hypothetical protein